ncbi:MAG TPA: hypothetical protein VEC76_05405 [Streptosporangiaceae bacterium]|nr:hypothetical protein [Streptosporangiaceae bacterium]
MVLLENVAHIPGSIGSAQASDVAAYGNSNVQPVEIDGLDAEVGAIGKALRPVDVGDGDYHNFQLPVHDHHPSRNRAW